MHAGLCAASLTTATGDPKICLGSELDLPMGQAFHSRNRRSSSMNPEAHTPTEADQSSDVALHDEIKRRAYELYQRGPLDTPGLDGLQAELPRTLYALAQLKKHANGEVGDIKRVRAAQVYLQALSACLGQRRESERMLAR